MDEKEQEHQHELQKLLKVITNEKTGLPIAQIVHDLSQVFKKKTNQQHMVKQNEKETEIV